jgi:2-dehydro-3-deoxygluconokinase
MAESVKRFVGFGELMLRLDPVGARRIRQADQFEVRFTGAEANVAVSLAGFGVAASVVSKVPDTDLGLACVDSIRRFGVNTDHVRRGGPRLGLLYVESGAAQRPSTVIYDRAGSSFAEAAPDDYEWDEILADATWLHFSGTAPALGGGVVAILEQALATARRLGVTVSCDLNYRSRLWSPEKAGSVLACLMPWVDVLFGSGDDAARVFGVDATMNTSAEERGRVIAARLAERFGLKLVATSLRETVGASAATWGGMVFDGHDHHVSRRYAIGPIVDRIGVGDAFAAGLIYGRLVGFETRRCVEFAAAAACLKHSIPGDFNLVSVPEVEALLAGNDAGRVLR